MLSKNVVALLTEQIMKELYSAYLYLDMANYYADEGLEGFENWFVVQAQEERDHAMLIRQYLLNNGEKVKLLAIDAPGGAYASFEAPLTQALDHEKVVTASINNIYAAGLKENDYRTLAFLNWFINEQAEEEKSADDLIKKYRLFGSEAKGLYELDKELGARTYAAPDLTFD